MNDMTQAIQPKSDQINADDMVGGPITIKVTGVNIKGGDDQPVSISFEGSQKVFRPCKSMSRVLVQAWGADAKNYVGRSMTLYRDPTVKWGGMEVGGIRISHLTDIDKKMVFMLTASKANRKPYTVSPLAGQTPFEPDPKHLQSARDAASNGKAAFGEWWKSADQVMRAAANSILEELQAASEKAQAEPEPADDEAPL